MATNEPMTDKRLAEIQARVKNAWAMQAVGPANFGELKRSQLQSIAVAYVDDVADLLAEVERLRAENAAMRMIVEAMAKEVEPRWYNEAGKWGCEFCTEESYNKRLFVHSNACPVTKARACVAQHPAQEAE